MPEIITRAEAKARGQKRFFTGVGCFRGHICERFTSSAGCIECKRQLSAFSVLSEKQLLKKRATLRRYYLRNRDQVLKREAARKRAYREKNPEKHKEQHRRDNLKYRAAHPEKHKKYRADYQRRRNERLRTAYLAVKALGITI